MSFKMITTVQIRFAVAIMAMKLAASHSFSATPPPPPPVPENVRVKTTFVMPLLGITEGTLVLDGDSWYFSVTPKEVALSNCHRTEEENIEGDCDDTIGWCEGRFREAFNVKANDNIYFSFDVPKECKTDIVSDVGDDEGDNCNSEVPASYHVWTADGSQNVDEDAMQELVCPFMLSAPLLLQAFASWDRIEPDTSEEASTHHDMVAWRIPNLHSGFDAIILYKEGSCYPHAISMQGDDTFGLLARLPIFFEEFEFNNPGHAAKEFALARKAVPRIRRHTREQG